MSRIYFADYPIPAAKAEPETGGIVNYLDELRKNVYRKKAEFVSGIAYAIRGEFGVTDIRYSRDDRGGEYVTIFYLGDKCDVINVTMNSHEAIFREIYKQLDGPGAYGYCRGLRYEDVKF